VKPPAGSLNLSLGGARPSVSHDVQLDVNVTLAKDLDEMTSAHGTGSNQSLYVYLATLGEQLGNAAYVNGLVLHAVAVLEATQLG